MGSGSGHDRATFMQSIHEFVAAALQAVANEKVRLKELTRTQNVEVGDHSFPVTTGYSFRFRGMPVTICKDATELVIDGVRVGRDVDPQLFERLKNACIERFVFQEHEAKRAYTEREQARQLAFRQEKYGPLVRRLRKAKAADRGRAKKATKKKK